MVYASTISIANSNHNFHKLLSLSIFGWSWGGRLLANGLAPPSSMIGVYPSPPPSSPLSLSHSHQLSVLPFLCWTQQSTVLYCSCCCTVVEASSPQTQLNSSILRVKSLLNRKPIDPIWHLAKNTCLSSSWPSSVWRSPNVNNGQTKATQTNNRGMIVILLYKMQWAPDILI